MLIKINLTIALDFNADAKESLDLNQFCRKKPHLTKWLSYRSDGKSYIYIRPWYINHIF